MPGHNKWYYYYCCYILGTLNKGDGSAVKGNTVKIKESYLLLSQNHRDKK